MLPIKNLSIIKIFIICFLILCQGCLTTPEADSRTPIKQKFLFEVTYVNHAWGFQLRGIYIDKPGQVYKYDHSHEVWRPSNPNFYTEEELLRKFESNKEFVKAVDSQTLLKMYNLIRTAKQGTFSEPVQRCNDAGTTAYIAYLFDSKANTYKPLLLYQVGDWARKNLSESAKVLYEWLFTFEGWAPGACTP
jgi:hypothetical protein